MTPLIDIEIVQHVVTEVEASPGVVSHSPTGEVLREVATWPAIPRIGECVKGLQTAGLVHMVTWRAGVISGALQPVEIRLIDKGAAVKLFAALRRSFGKVLCRLAQHDYYPIERVSPDSDKVGCTRCARQWGMHHPTRGFLPWYKVKELYEGPRATFRDFERVPYIRREQP